MRSVLHAAVKDDVKARLAAQAHACTWCGRSYTPRPDDILSVVIARGKLAGSTHCPHCRAYQVLYVQYVRTLNQANRGLTLLHA